VFVGFLHLCFCFVSGVEVVLFTSNCANAGAKGRYQYIEELMKHVDIHSYGKCFKNREEPEYPYDPIWPQIAQRRARKIKILSNYRFYLAFENYPVDDYVSEKVDPFFESLSWLSVVLFFVFAHVCFLGF
jgi:hypothetical protein